MIATVVIIAVVAIAGAVLLANNVKFRTDVEARIAALEAKIKTKLP